MSKPNYDIALAQEIMKFIDPIRGVDEPDKFLPKPIMHLLMHYVEQACNQLSRAITQQLSFESVHPGSKAEEQMEQFLNAMQDYAEDWSADPITQQTVQDIMNYFQALPQADDFPPKPIGAYLMGVYRERVFYFAEFIEEHYQIDGFTKEIRHEQLP